MIAKHQTNGKGRNGSSWISNNGNFSGSVIFFPVLQRFHLHLYGFFFGVALYDTIKKIVKDGVDIRLKWPNDLIIENYKVGGILLESIQAPCSGKRGLIVGIGINLNSSPILKENSNKQYDTQCVASFTNDKIDLKKFFRDFCYQLNKLESNVQEKKLSSILSVWQTRSYDKGTMIQIFDNKRKLKTGTFLGLDELGGLIVGENSGVKKIYSGDVYFGS
tara:strand:+ start:2578 stop:3234 length:657 start_codon:yes stop_codon:yes gene_type:complete